MRDRVRERLGRAALFAAAVAACALLIEAALRLAGYAPARYQAPGELYGDRERELGPKAPGTIRVVLLGDSFTEGQGVKEPDTTARRLQALLSAGGGRWEVLNCARRGADFPS